MKKKSIAAFFAFPFGVFGLHRFYLGQRLFGILYLASFIWGIYIAEAIYWIEFPFLLIPAVISFVDAMLFWAMSKEDFDAKYNRQYVGYASRKQPKKSTFSNRFSRKSPRHNRFKIEGIEKFKDFDFEGAIEDFKLSLGVNYEDPAAHFNLGCCYSYLEDGDAAFFHLNKAVEFGFVDFEKIYKHESLAWLRVHPQFETFVKNGYRLTAALPESKIGLLETFPEPESEFDTTNETEEDLLDQIVKLGDLRDKGILTQEEFVLQKKKLLG
ncbi:MAG: NINE protein [Bacteroidetes bacterium]|jgi:TM2 domain-containing membrane protein YozV|nr:NINE protein [Bacteroidota bacterium]